MGFLRVGTGQGRDAAHPHGPGVPERLLRDAGVWQDVLPRLSKACPNLRID